MKPGMALLRFMVVVATAFVVGYLLGLNAPGTPGAPVPALPGARTAPANPRVPPGAAAAGEGPRIRFAQELFDFGTVEQGQKVVHVFEFTNAGNVPLEISDVTTSCGCTATMLSSRRLAPGEKGQVRAEFDSEKYRDKVQIWLHLFTNDPRRRQATILLQGNVAQFLRVDPQELDLGVVGEGQQVRGSIRVEAARPGEAFRILGIESSSDAVALGPVQEDFAHPGAAYTIPVSLRGRPPYGMLWDSVRLRTDHPERPTLEVKVSRTVTSSSEQPSATPSPSGTPAVTRTASPTGAHHR